MNTPTREKVLQFARQAWEETGNGWTADAWFDDRVASFERFAVLVAAYEREACAKVCDSEASKWPRPSHGNAAATIAANAIRARGKP